MKKSFKKLEISLAAASLLSATIVTTATNTFASVETDPASKNEQISSPDTATNEKNDNTELTGEEGTVTINGVTMTQAELLDKVNDMTISYEDDNLDDIFNNTGKTGFMPKFAPAIAAVGSIPGIGEVVVTAAGVILIGGMVVKAGSALYNKAVELFSPHRSNARHSTRDKHTKPRPGRSSEKKKGSKKWHSRK